MTQKKRLWEHRTRYWILNFLFRVVHPSFWMNNYTVSGIYDKELNRLLDTERLDEIRQYTVRLGTLIIWIGNYPYAYGQPYNPEIDVMPLPLTRVRIFNAIIAARTGGKL